MTFTVEEMILLGSFDTSDRIAAIFSLWEEVSKMQDEELKNQCEIMIKKLKKMPDEVFESIDFTVYDEE